MATDERLHPAVWALGAAVLAAAAIAPIAKALLPADDLVAYQARLGLGPRADEHHEMGRLPQHFADMRGWRAMAESVAEAVATLPEEVRSRACVFGRDSGEAGAIELYGPKLGLPPRVRFGLAPQREAESAVWIGGDLRAAPCPPCFCGISSSRTAAAVRGRSRRDSVRRGILPPPCGGRPWTFRA